MKLIQRNSFRDCVAVIGDLLPNGDVESFSVEFGKIGLDLITGKDYCPDKIKRMKGKMFHFTRCWLHPTIDVVMVSTFSEIEYIRQEKG